MGEGRSAKPRAEHYKLCVIPPVRRSLALIKNIHLRDWYIYRSRDPSSPHPPSIVLFNKLPKQTYSTEMTQPNQPTYVSKNAILMRRISK